MLRRPQLDALRLAVFDRQRTVYAVLDGNKVEKLSERLYASDAEYACLFSGKLVPVLEASAPYIVRLSPHGRFAASVLREGWRRRWGILLHTQENLPLHELREHLRRFLRLVTPDGQAKCFRYFDPCAFKREVPSLTESERRAFFEPIRGALVQGPTPSTALYFDRHGPHGRLLELTALDTACPASTGLSGSLAKRAASN
ncbi:DUF4123 domain-containing protein [Dyella tabacisoli]|uniref:DUF4123 domain-containing protein n=1 Tax=Dyella tabacisoli TaxID=2282381 RepID=A0A369UHY3_9GAMM|nr:DUF4123 domain-containing protein [Dyella tabacisoli]RDD80181.1 DUF4123 domain-containing protein [Dyella tabacisoli]